MDETEGPSQVSRKRFLLGQLGARGDCLYATAVAHQIKVDHPGCHLTWGIGSVCAPLLKGNPHVDAVWEWPMDVRSDMTSCWRAFEREALAAQARGEYDEVYFTQVFPDHFARFDGTVRKSIFRGYPRPITVPVEPVLYLQPDEVENVARFARDHQLDNGQPVVLFEFSAHSGQSFVKPQFVIDLANGFLRHLPGVRLVLSSNVHVDSPDPNIIDGSALSFRENAELTKYCTLLVGVSSGISWLCTSSWAKRIPMIQLLSASTSVYASFVHDYESRGADSSLILEMTDCSPDHLIRAVIIALGDGFPAARQQFHQAIPVDFGFYFQIMAGLLRDGHFDTVIESASQVVARYGPRDDFAETLQSHLANAVATRLRSKRPAKTTAAPGNSTAVTGALGELRQAQQELAGHSMVALRELHRQGNTAERLLMLQGRLAAWELRARETIDTLVDVEFTVFSQWGEDGIIEWLVQQLSGIPERFVEFGVESYLEANTRFLLQHRNWTGLVMDGSEANIQSLRSRDLFWRHDLSAEAAFITRENINQLLHRHGFTGDLGILSIDIDGNDYWVWEAIECVSPAIVIVEYNPILGDLAPLVVPYRADFTRFSAHHSGLLFGSSISALCLLAERKGYVLLGSNANGINAFFVRKDLFRHLESKIQRRIAWPSRHRDARDRSGRLVFTGGIDRFRLISEATVVDVSTGQPQTLGAHGLPYSERWK